MGNVDSWALQCSAFTLAQCSLPLSSLVSVRHYQAGEGELWFHSAVFILNSCNIVSYLPKALFEQ